VAQCTHISRAVRGAYRPVGHDPGETTEGSGPGQGTRYAVNSGEIEEDVGSVAVASATSRGARWRSAVAAPASRLSAQRISRIGELMIETIPNADVAWGRSRTLGLRTAARASGAGCGGHQLTTASSANAARLPTPGYGAGYREDECLADAVGRHPQPQR